MDAHTVVEEWDASPFSGGFAGIDTLRAGGFSGAVEAGADWLFLESGDPVAVVGDLETAPRPGSANAFEGASGRQHEAPYPATAKLAAMLALDGDVRGQYFSDETPLSTVHETLSEGGFTGYVELSENVLSGDYYVVYEDGAADHVGFVGGSNRLVTGEEAERKAEGEVGIYSVVAVSLPAVDIPEPDRSAGAGGTAATGGAGPGVSANTGTGTGAGEPDAGPADVDPEPVGGDSEPTGIDPVGAGTDDGGSTTEPTLEPGDPGETDTSPTLEPGESEDATGTEPTLEPGGPEDDTGTEPTPAPGESEPAADEAGVESDREPDGEPETDPDPDPDPAADSGPGGAGISIGGEPDTEADAGAAPEPGTEPDSEPGETGAADAAAPDPGTASGPEPTREPAEGSPSTGPTGEAGEEPTAGAGDATGTAGPDRVEAVRREYEARIEELQSELASVREERDRLRNRVAQLETEEPAAGGGAMSAREALAKTSLFVREGSRGGATLEKARSGDVSQKAVADNTRIEYHTEFDEGAVTVDGQPFAGFLAESDAYAFVGWLVTELLFEIRSTGTEGALRQLYDALPEVDRISFHDTVTVETADGETEFAFDIVARDGMGDPLFVAALDEGREPTQVSTMESLVRDAADTCEQFPALVGAFAVTSSYFDPDAKKAADEATSGSLLSREKYRGYVRLSRGNGFHLCLVEYRDGSFNLTMPEL